MGHPRSPHASTDVQTTTRRLGRVIRHRNSRRRPPRRLVVSNAITGPSSQVGQGVRYPRAAVLDQGLTVAVDETLLEQHDRSAESDHQQYVESHPPQRLQRHDDLPAARSTPTRAAAGTNAKGECCQVTMADQ